jgi:hypothetical protein
MKLTSQMPSSTSLMPSFWPASTVKMLILRCRQKRPRRRVTRRPGWLPVGDRIHAATSLQVVVSISKLGSQFSLQHLPVAFRGRSGTNTNRRGIFVAAKELGRPLAMTSGLSNSRCPRAICRRPLPSGGTRRQRPIRSTGGRRRRIGPCSLRLPAKSGHCRLGSNPVISG